MTFIPMDYFGTELRFKNNMDLYILYYYISLKLVQKHVKIHTIEEAS